MSARGSLLAFGMRCSCAKFQRYRSAAQALRKSATIIAALRIDLTRHKISDRET
jgi:hypothetical protein